jgi:hypothetical protein
LSIDRRYDAVTVGSCGGYFRGKFAVGDDRRIFSAIAVPKDVGRAQVDDIKAIFIVNAKYW